MNLPVKLKIGEFAQLSGITVKTVLYYHKIGLLPEPLRSPGGYRLYGITDVKRILAVKRLKALGFSLQKIKEEVERSDSPGSGREVLLDLEAELLAQKDQVEAKLARIRKLLAHGGNEELHNTTESGSFQMFMDALGEESHLQYQKSCPELYRQEEEIYKRLDEMQLDVNYHALLQEAAAYFNTHPDQYQQSLRFGEEISALAALPENSPEIETLAGSYAAFIKTIPLYKQLLMPENALNVSLEAFFQEICAEVYSPAQMKFMLLLSHYLMAGNQQ